MDENRDSRVGNHDAVLNVEALDFRQVASVGAVIGDELGDNGEGLAGVDGEALAVEGGVALAVRVEVASIGVAEALKSQYEYNECSERSLDVPP